MNNKGICIGTYPAKTIWCTGDDVSLELCPPGRLDRKRDSRVCAYLYDGVRMQGAYYPSSKGRVDTCILNRSEVCRLNIAVRHIDDRSTRLTAVAVIPKFGDQDVKKMMFREPRNTTHYTNICCNTENVKWDNIKAIGLKHAEKVIPVVSNKGFNCFNPGKCHV